MNSLNELFGGDLMDYQEKIKNFFLKSDRDILLLYMKVGTGKTLTSLACAIEAVENKNYDNIIILSPKSVQHEFKSNLKLYQSFKKYNQTIHDKITLIAYNGNNAQEKFKNLRKYYK